MKPFLLSILLLFFVNSFSQTSVSQFADPSGKYSVTSTGVCFGCSISNTSRVADMDLSNYATIDITAGLAVTRGIRVKLNNLSPGNTYAGFFVTIGSVISALPSVSIATYKTGSWRQTVVTNGNIITLLGGSSGYIMGLASAGLDYDEVGITINGGFASVGMTARIYYALGGYNSMPMFTLPVKFKSVNVRSENDNPLVSWMATTDEPALYEVQRSFNGIDFDSIAVLTSQQSNTNETFSFEDLHANNRNSFYRIVAISLKNGAETYSQVVKFDSTNSIGQTLRVYPNPVLSNTVYVTGIATNSLPYSMRLINSNGTVVYASTVNGNNGQVAIRFSNWPAPGFYILELLPVGKASAPKLISRLLFK